MKNINDLLNELPDGAAAQSIKNMLDMTEQVEEDAKKAYTISVAMQKEIQTLRTGIGAALDAERLVDYRVGPTALDYHAVTGTLRETLIKANALWKTSTV